MVGSVCLSVTQHLECLFVSKSVPHSKQAAKVRMFVWISLKMLHCRARALPPLYGHALVGHFYSATSTGPGAEEKAVQISSSLYHNQTALVTE